MHDYAKLMTMMVGYRLLIHINVVWKLNGNKKHESTIIMNQCEHFTIFILNKQFLIDSQYIVAVAAAVVAHLIKLIDWAGANHSNWWEEVKNNFLFSFAFMLIYVTCASDVLFFFFIFFLFYIVQMIVHVHVGCINIGCFFKFWNFMNTKNKFFFL